MPTQIDATVRIQEVTLEAIVVECCLSSGHVANIITHGCYNKEGVFERGTAYLLKDLSKNANGSWNLYPGAHVEALEDSDLLSQPPEDTR